MSVVSKIVAESDLGVTISSGIGYTAAKHFARKGATVYIGVRSEAKGKAAVEGLEAEGIGSGKVIYHECELGAPQQAKTAALEFMKRVDRLDILGITRMMMVNYFGVFVLTNTLLPLLTRTAQKPNADVRIIAVSSNAHTVKPATNPNIRFNNLDEFKKAYDNAMFPFTFRYAMSKLALTLFSNALQRRVDPNIICISLHPGIVYTPIVRYDHDRIINLALWLFGTTAEKGSYTTLFAAASPKVKTEPEKYKGADLNPVGVLYDPNPHALRHDLQDELWTTTEQYLASIGLN
ncbi:hypothetical protein CVT24_007916 [Panaeolus cyanescens]|uniref:NAD(P)-binding protein n=1 Tax=Panaeolus cyanescens TaxID=181874 RepID=A0A409W0E0_9AGAR|nr:hypothetical protein CVT24_007916 [Panaeolus cyanescens]